MDEKTKLLVCLGAAAAANCIPCFEYYHEKALAAGLAAEDVEEAVESACQIKSNVNMLMKNRVRALTGREDDAAPAASCRKCS